MLPITMERSKDERSKDTAEISHSAMNFLWRLSVRTGISRRMLPMFKIMVILGASVTVVCHRFILRNSFVKLISEFVCRML